jgi:hypothetical protein
MLTRVSALLQHWKRTGEKFDSHNIWLRVGKVIATAVTDFDWPGPR